MCGRFYVAADSDDISDEELRRVIDEANRKIKFPEMKTSGKIFPSNIVPVITSSGPEAMRWGFTRFDGKGLVINSRSEGITEKPMFKKR